MGYDMSVVDEHGDRVSCENNYWRRNIFGGSKQAEKLVELGMAQWPTTNDRPRFPDRPEHVRAEYEAHEEAGDYDWDHPDWLALLHPHLKDRRGSTQGIAAYKLCDSNDGWWVTREECEQALAAWEQAGRPDVDDFGSGPIGDTIPFLQAAAAHHGFRVW